VPARTVKSSHLILPGNSAGHLDLKWAGLKTTASRIEIAPSWKTASGITALGSAVPSLAVLDSFTGFTIAQGRNSGCLALGYIRPATFPTSAFKFKFRISRCK
jgi:hypothetical protein